VTTLIGRGQAEFAIELDAYKEHLLKIGYPAGEVTLMIIGFSAGWVAHRDVVPPRTRPQGLLQIVPGTFAAMVSDLAAVRDKADAAMEPPS